MNPNKRYQIGQSFAILDYVNLFGFLPLKTSLDLNWENLFAMTLPYPAGLPSTPLPPIVEEDEILVQLSSPGQIKGGIGKEEISTVGVSGTFSIAPNYLPTNWPALGNPPQVLVLSVKHILLIQIALQAMGIDSKYVCLVGKVCDTDPLIGQIGQLVLGEIETAGLAGNLFIDALTQTLAIHLLRNYMSFPQRNPHVKGHLPPKVLRSVLDFIDASLEENLSLEKIAAVANLSSFHFSRLFKQTMNIPVHKYVLQKRLDCGKDLLTRGGLTVTEVAARTGFADASHFDRHFKRRFGISPKIMTK